MNIDKDDFGIWATGLEGHELKQSPVAERGGWRGPRRTSRCQIWAARKGSQEEGRLGE